MSWPLCFDAKTIKRLEKSWSPYGGMLPHIQALTSELYEICLNNRELQPSTVRLAADGVFQEQLGLYSFGDWSKIIYRMSTTLQNLVSSVERSLTLQEVNLLEARFELGFFDDIEGYAKQMAVSGKPDQALALARRMHEAGSDGAVALIASVAVECSGLTDPRPIKHFLCAATDDVVSWADGAEFNFWKNNKPQLSPLVHLERLLSGEYPWTKMSLRFVEQRLSSDTVGLDSRSMSELFADLPDDKKVDLLSAAYGAKPPEHLRDKYKTIIGMLVPNKILKENPANVMVDVMAGRCPSWLSTVLRGQARGLADFYSSIECSTYQVIYSSPEQIQAMELPERFAHGMSSLVFTLADDFRDGFDSTRFVEWGSSGRQVVVIEGDIGNTLVRFFRETMPHIVFSKKPKDEAVSFQDFLDFLQRSDVHEFMLMAGAILKGLGRDTEMAGVLVQSFPNDPLIVRDFANLLGIPKEELMKSHWYRDFHLAGDLGL